MEILLIGISIGALVGYMIGKPKGRAGDGAVLGAILGPIGWLIIACGKSEGMRKCPYCAEEVKSEASVCRFCSRDLPALPIKPIKPPKPAMSVKAQLAIIIAVVGTIIGIVSIGVWQASKPAPHVHYENGAIIQDNATGSIPKKTVTPEIRRAIPIQPSNDDRFGEYSAIAREVPHERLRTWPVGDKIGMDLLVKPGLTDQQLAKLIRWYVSVGARTITVYDNPENARKGESMLASYMCGEANDCNQFERLIYPNGQDWTLRSVSFR